MKQMVFMLLAFHLNLFSEINAQQINEFRVQNADLKSCIDKVEQLTGTGFLYNGRELEQVKGINLDLKNVDLTVVLEHILRNTGYSYQLMDGVVAILKQPAEEMPQVDKQVVKGVVKDEEGNPLPGVTIVIEGTTLGCATDVEGRYSLVVPSKEVTLVYSFVGMEQQKVKTDQKSVVDVVMKMSRESLDEVVVTGMFNRKKEGFTGSATRMSGDEIKKMTSGNVLRAIEMLDPGFRMNVSNVAGSNPNAIPDFEMRGQSNMGDYSTDDVVIMRGDIDTRPNQPLFVLDGIIGVGVSKIIDMDPEQIESITLLKDAAAMVIYGSRASNGVVVVETKAPERGKLRVSYNGNYKFQTPDLSVYNLLEAKDKLELEHRAGFYDESYTAENTHNLLQEYKTKLLEVERGVNTYWLSQPVQTAFLHRHGINLEGGDQALRYKIYFGLNQGPGVMKETGVYSKNGSVDIRYRYKNLFISNQIYIDYTVGERTSPYGSFSTYGTMNPYYRLSDESGAISKILEYNYNIDGARVPAVLNPMYNILYNQKDKSTSFEVRDAFRVEYTPIENLRLSMDINVSKLTSDVDVFKPSAHTDFDGKDIEKKGTYNWNKGNTINYNVSFTANYNKVFAADHLLSVFARYDIDERYNHNASVNVTGFPNDKMDEVFLGALTNKITGSEGRSRSIGFVGTVNYAYKQRYAVDFSARVDASSEFGKNNRMAPFWSAGARWNMDKENWIKTTGIFDELVIRGTYGVTGSQGFSPYQSLQMYTYDGMLQVYNGSDVIGTKLLSMGNPNLKWQKTDSYNVGLDFNMFHRIVSGRFEYYYKYTRNTLISLSLPPSMGFATIPDNMGNISNKGYEVTLRVMPYNNLEKQLNFNIVAMGSHNKNRIEKISNALRIRNAETAGNVTSRPLPRYEEGYSQSMIWGVRSLGIDPMSGRELLLKRNGEKTTTWDALDQVPLGDSEPKLRGTLSANLNWKGFSLSVAGQYRFGGQLYNYTLIEKVENANLRYNVDRRAFTERWQKPGDVTFFKGITKNVNGQATKASSRFVMDNNEFSINTINLQYRFEQRYHSFIKRAGLTSASVGLYLEDLIRLSTIKMERGIDYPFARQASLSLNLVF